MRGAMIPNCVECAQVKEMKSRKGEGHKAKEELNQDEGERHVMIHVFL